MRTLRKKIEALAARATPPAYWQTHASDQHPLAGLHLIRLAFTPAPANIKAKLDTAKTLSRKKSAPASTKPAVISSTPQPFGSKATANRCISTSRGLLHHLHFPTRNIYLPQLKEYLSYCSAKNSLDKILIHGFITIITQNLNPHQWTQRLQ